MRDYNREQEILQKPVSDFSGAGEAEVVQDILSDDFVEMGEAEALDLALALQQLVRGQASILANQQNMEGELARLKADAERRDRVMEEYKADQEKFFQRVREEGQSLKADEQTKARMLERSQQTLSEMTAFHRHEKNAVREKMRNEPKESVVWPGESFLSREGSQAVQRSRPLVVHINGETFTAKIGDVVQVPQCVAARLREIERTKEENNERRKVLSAEQSDTFVAGKWAKINAKFGSPTQGFLARGDL